MLIRPGMIVCYDYWNGPRKFKELQPHKEREPLTVPATYQGYISPGTAKRLRRTIALLVAQAKEKIGVHPHTGKTWKWKINFITTTMSAPQYNVSDREIKNVILAGFLRDMRRKYGLRSYVWRAERQANGRIHFHITSDSWLDYRIIRDVWNFHQSKFHFIADYQSRYPGQQPNSCDVHSVKDVKDLAAYMVKYMTKDCDENGHIQGKIWDCSTNLKKTVPPSVLMGKREFEFVKWASSRWRSFSDEKSFAYCLAIPDHEMKAQLPEWLRLQYIEYLESVYRAADARYS